MAQDGVVEIPVRMGSIWQAWWEALRYPKYETYAGWYPRMRRRWRRNSLAISLALLIVASFVLIAHNALVGHYTVRTLLSGAVLDFLGTPEGMYELVSCLVGVLFGIVSLPALVAIFGPRNAGNYRRRFYVNWCTWMQCLPIASGLLLWGAIDYLILALFGVDGYATSLISAESWAFYTLLIFFLLYFQSMAPLGLAASALGAASGISPWNIYGIELALYICFFTGGKLVIAAIFGWFGHPVAWA